MNGRTTFALTVAFASTLTTGASTTAYAWDTHGTVAAAPTWAGYEPATLERLGSVNADVLARYVDAKLDKVEQLAATVSARVATMRAGEVRWWLDKVTYARRVLAGVDGAEERVAALDATLASLQARLAARLDALKAEAARLAAQRRAAVEAARARLAAKAEAAREAKVLGTRDGHRCDRDGWWDGDRDGDRWGGDGDRWDGDGWDGWR